MAIHPKTASIKNFKGLNNVLRPERTPKEYLKEADNVDIDKSGGIQKRKGFTKVANGSYHSCWADYPFFVAVKDNNLVSLDSEYNSNVLMADVGSSPVSYFRLDDSLYFSSVYSNGVIEDGAVRPWGIDPPNPRPNLSIVAGGLPTGTYQVALTYVSSDGRESGAPVASIIHVPGNNGILVENIPTSSDPTVVAVNIYMSHDNGESLYYKGKVANGTSSYVLSDDSGLRRSLDTFNMVPPPKGHIIEVAHGRSWVAEDNFLWYSEPFQYELFDYRKNYLRFPKRIRAVMPTTGGMWIAADGLYYMRGENPETSDLVLKEPIKVVEGSSVRIPGAYIFIENTPIGYKWIFHSNKGIYVAFNDGVVLNMTSQNYEFQDADNGVAAFIQEDGINRYISLLKQPKMGSESATVGDLITATIIRNGVVVTE